MNVIVEAGAMTASALAIEPVAMIVLITPPSGFSIKPVVVALASTIARLSRGRSSLSAVAPALSFGALQAA